MNTCATIFIKNSQTNLYNGISVKYDGYIKHGVGEILYRNWNDITAISNLCNSENTKLNILGVTIENCVWDEQNQSFDKQMKNLSYDNMLKISSSISLKYTYIFENSNWMIIKREPEVSLELVSNFINY